MGFLRTSLSALFALGVVSGFGLEARGRVADGREGKVVMATSSVSMDQAVKMAEQRFKARVVRAETQREGAHTIYILRLLNDAGRVWAVRVDATNGAIL